MKDKVTGKAEELQGRLTHDRSVELKGKARQAKGEVERKTRRLADDLEDLARPRQEPNAPPR